MNPSELAISKGRESLADADEGTVNLRTHLSYFQQCHAHRELLKSIQVIVPVRPADGMNCQLTRMLSIWYGEGTGWSNINDHMGGFIEYTRANIVHHFIHNQRHARFLLMIDNDMEPPVNLPYLLARHNQPVVAAPAATITQKYGLQLCFTVKDTGGEYRFPCMKAGAKVPGKGLVEVGHSGTGAMLIRRDVLEAFTFENNDVPFYVPENIRVEGARTGHLKMGEDITFCDAVREKGFKVYVDMEAHCGHRKTIALAWPEHAIDPDMPLDEFVLPATGHTATGGNGANGS